MNGVATSSETALDRGPHAQLEDEAAQAVAMARCARAVRGGQVAHHPVQCSLGQAGAPSQLGERHAVVVCREGEEHGNDLAEHGVEADTGRRRLRCGPGSDHGTNGTRRSADRQPRTLVFPTATASSFPITNARNDIYGFVGRDLSGHAAAPKYRNPTRTPLFRRPS